MVTDDKTWIYHRQLYHKSKNASCLGESESPTTVVRRSKFEGQSFFSTFFTSNGIHCVDEGKSIDHNYYIENCLKLVVKEIWKERRSVDTKGMKLLENNA